MKKLILGFLVVLTAFSLVACNKNGNNRQQDNSSTSEQQNIDNNSEQQTSDSSQGQLETIKENTRLVNSALEETYKKTHPDIIEEIVITGIRIYLPEEIASDETFNDYTINKGDIVFDVDYDLRVVEGYDNMNEFTAGTGEVDGQWIRNKHNVGIVRESGDSLKIDAFGTSF